MAWPSLAFQLALSSTYVMALSVPPQSDIFLLLASRSVWVGRLLKLLAGIVAFGVAMVNSESGSGGGSMNRLVPTVGFTSSGGCPNWVWGSSNWKPVK